MVAKARRIEISSWDRREHYEFFQRFGYPYWSVTTEIDIGPLRNTLRERGISFTVGLAYVLSRAANEVPQFRQRIRDDCVVEYAHVDPGVTVLTEDDKFRFCLLQYDVDFARFAPHASREIKAARAAKSLGGEADRDDLLYFSVLPWFAFSGILHPLPLDTWDSVPRFAWGRFEEKNGKHILPLNVQAHHGLVDGIHVAKLFKGAEDLIQSAELTL